MMAFNQNFQEMNNLLGSLLSRLEEIYQKVRTCEQNATFSMNDTMFDNPFCSDIGSFDVYQEIEQCLWQFVSDLDQAGQQLSHLLVDWKRRQRLTQIGAPFETNSLNADLDAFDSIYCEIFFVYFGIRNNVRQEPGGLLYIVDYFRQINSQINRTSNAQAILSTACNQVQMLIFGCCLVASQPPHIQMMANTLPSRARTTSNNDKPVTLRKNARPLCQPVIRILGAQSLGLQVAPVAQCLLIPEERARDLANGLVNVEQLIENSESLLNAVHEANFKCAPGGCIARFNPLHVPSRNIDASCGSESGSTAGDTPTNSGEHVTKKRYNFVFSIGLTNATSMAAQSAGLTHPFWLLSLPCGLFSNPKQWTLQGGEQYLFWNLAFSQGDGILQEPQSVVWSEFIEALSWKFCQFTGSKRIISEKTTSKHLKAKLIKTELEINDDCVTYDGYFKRFIDSNFTFREWFYGVMKVVKDYPGRLDLWNRGLIHFASRDIVERFLSRQTQPTLMIRFCDSKCDSDVVLSYGCQGRSVEHLHPEFANTSKQQRWTILQVIQMTKELREVQMVCAYDCKANVWQLLPVESVRTSEDHKRKETPPAADPRYKHLMPSASIAPPMYFV